ncbi:MAG: hypothetical protein NVS4B11_06250 [Ktedonobacteraceae bacterium]
MEERHVHPWRTASPESFLIPLLLSTEDVDEPYNKTKESEV